MLYSERKINVFEKILLVIGILVIIMGYVFIHDTVVSEGIGFAALQTIFLWFILIVLIILAAVNDNMKEELKIVIINQAQEIRLLREDIKKYNHKKKK